MRYQSLNDIIKSNGTIKPIKTIRTIFLPNSSVKSIFDHSSHKLHNLIVFMMYHKYMSCNACDSIETAKSKYGEVFLQTDNIIGLLMSEGGVSPGHCLFLPKEHHEKMHTVPDEVLSELIRTVKKVANILELENYNVLQNNGALAFQTLFHVHFHLIPKTAENEGLRYLRDSDLERKFDNTEVLARLKQHL